MRGNFSIYKVAMNNYKKEEIGHYDKLAREWREKSTNKETARTDIEKIDVMKMTSYQFVYELLKKYAPNKKVLDYGCGHGMHATEIAKMGANEIIGIDLSEESLKIAKNRAGREGIAQKIKFIKMDAEKLEFPNNSFDIVFDGGTFSSIDISKGLPEIARVLKPNGYLIGIETLGHHPLANLKRRLNRKHGVRTNWATAHIMKMKDFKLAKQYFDIKERYFFHFLSLMALPFKNLPGGSILVKITETIDKIVFLLFPFLKRYGFKTVFVLQK